MLFLYEKRNNGIKVVKIQKFEYMSEIIKQMFKTKLINVFLIQKYFFHQTKINFFITVTSLLWKDSSQMNFTKGLPDKI